MNNTKFQIGAEVQLFKTNLVGMIDSETATIIVRQPKAGVEAPGVSIDEFITEIKDVFKKFGVAIPEINLPEAVKKTTEGISIYLKEIFMLIKTKEKKSIDFAIWISMDISEELKKMFPVTINSGYLKVWNTNNKVIVDELDIGTIQKLLGEGGSQKKIEESETDKEK